MALLVLLALLALPFIEIALFIEAGRAIGVAATLSLTLLTAVGGLAIVRIQGLNNFRRMQQAMDQGDPPIGEIVHGVLLLVAGVFLLIPGFFTDAVGALLLIPQVRAVVGVSFFRMLERQYKHRHPNARREDVVIDAEFWEEDETADRSHPDHPRLDRPSNDDDPEKPR